MVTTDHGRDPRFRVRKLFPAEPAREGIGADGEAHVTYFDSTLLLSFVWHPNSDWIQVGEGGYGEPTRWLVGAPVLAETANHGGSPLTLAAGVIEMFRDRCRDFCEWYNDDSVE